VAVDAPVALLQLADADVGPVGSALIGVLPAQSPVGGAPRASAGPAGCLDGLFSIVSCFLYADLFPNNEKLFGP
jgi:hypothetical protein